MSRLPRFPTPVPMGWPEIPSLEVAEVLAQSAAAAAEVCGVDSATILLLAEPERMLQPAACHSRWRSVAPCPLDGPTLAARVFRSRRPEAVEDVLNQPDRDWSRTRDIGIRSLLAVPIESGPRTLGVLCLGRLAPHRFEGPEFELASQVSRHLAVSVEKANLYREATLRIAELSLLHEVARAINEGRDLDRILAEAADRLAALLDASNCFVLLLDQATSELRGAAASGRSPGAEVAGIRLGPTSKSIAVTAVLEERPIVVADAAADPRVNQDLVRRFSEKSLLAIPMLHRGRSIGCLMFDETRQRREFTQAEIDRVLAVASQLAAAVENARLHEDLKRSYAELAMAQARLVQRERLAALGELAAVVAHEVRNPLGAIFNATGELARLVDGRGEAGVLLSVLGEEADRINRIIGDLLDFARPPDLAVDQVSLASAIDEAASSSLLRPGISFQVTLEPGVDKLRMDQRQIRQALLNVFNNAVQAMGGQGSVRVHVHRAGGPGPEAVAIEIADSGPGVPAALRDRIFEPFFTTKASGTGLGLAVVKRIVEGHGGSVAVRDGPAGGAVFVLNLPYATGADA